jgi:hypothetical protein
LRRDPQASQALDIELAQAIADKPHQAITIWRLSADYPH